MSTQFSELLFDLGFTMIGERDLGESFFPK